MAPLLEDPRIRQTWNNISHNAETATESAAAGIWSFTHEYISPCFASISSGFEQCTSACFPDRDERARRLRERGRARGRAEYSFDFYDDWEDEETQPGSGSLLGWGNDELDRLLAGSGAAGRSGEQPGKKKGMSYGTNKSRGNRQRQHTIDGLPDPTVIPNTNTFGFLQRLPWKLGGTLRYKPSAADLQEHPGSRREQADEYEGEPLIDDSERSDNDAEGGDIIYGHRRKRSSTQGSGETSDSFRSRGDLFPSDGEDDAVPLDDEFAMVLERRSTGMSMDDRSSGKARSTKGKRPVGSRARTASRTTQSSGSSQPPLMKRSSSGVQYGLVSPETDSPGFTFPVVENTDDTPSLGDLMLEEERLRKEEDDEMDRKRRAAAELALERGLAVEEQLAVVKAEDGIMADDAHMVQQSPEDADTVPTSAAEHLEVAKAAETSNSPVQHFVPARLPNF